MLDCQMEQFLNPLDSSGKDSKESIDKWEAKHGGTLDKLVYHIQTNQSFCFTAILARTLPLKAISLRGNICCMSMPHGQQRLKPVRVKRKYVSHIK